MARRAPAGCPNGTKAGRAGAGFERRRLLDAHPQIVPGGLAGDRVGIGVVIAAIRRQQFRDQVVEQKAPCGTRASPGSRSQAPARLPIAFQVHTVSRVDPIHQPGRNADPAVMARQPDPVVLGEAERPAGGPVHEEPVVADGSAAARRSASARNGTSASAAGSARAAGRSRGRSAPPRTAGTRTAADRNRSRSAGGAPRAAAPRHGPRRRGESCCSGST